MGATCCGNREEDPHNLPAAPDNLDIILEKSVSGVDTARLRELLMKEQNAIKYIIRLQAWCRGIRSRKLHPTAGGLKPITIIKYVGEKLAECRENVQATETKLGPYILNWDVKSGKGILELRKLVAEGADELYVGYWNKSTNKKEGYGQQVYPNGTKYEGLWKDGLPDGEGRFIFENGDYYVGGWKQQKADGIGTFVSVDKTTYSGGWKEHLHHGHGIETRPDGSKYEGDFVMGKKEGRGKFIWTDGSSYEGDFVNDGLCGEGTYTWADGRKYTGGFKDNKQNGKGTLSFPDGKVYAGDFLNDLRHGSGTMTW